MDIQADTLTEHPIERSKARVQSVSRALSILFAVADTTDGLTTSDIRKRTGLPVQATYHLIQSLQSLGVLRKSKDNTYVLGLRVGDLLEGFQRQFSCPDELHSLIKRIATRTGETSYASSWVDDELVTLCVVPGNNPIQAHAETKYLAGNAHARASGKLLLALATESVVARFFRDNALTSMTKNTLVSEDDLRKEFERIRLDGFARDREEYADGLSCIAFPLKLGAQTFAICLSAPTARLDANLDRNKNVILSEINDLK